MKAYLASFFFDKFGYEGTKKLAEDIREAVPNIELYVPQENDEINDKENNDSTITAEAIYQADTDKLLASQVLIACIDGVEIDAGVACEIGAFAGCLDTLAQLQLQHTPKYIIALYSDMRRNGTGDNRMYKNLYVKGAIEKYGTVVGSTEEITYLLNKIQKEYYS